jgi:hypothetical protein
MLKKQSHEGDVQSLQFGRCQLIRPRGEPFTMAAAIWAHLDALCVRESLDRPTFYELAVRRYPTLPMSEAVQAMILEWFDASAEGQAVDRQTIMLPSSLLAQLSN